jgi:hypothetical protein
MAKKSYPRDTEEYEVIFRSYITLKNGKRLYASTVGKKAFPIYIKKSDKKS